MPDELLPIGPYISPTNPIIAATKRFVAAAGGRTSHEGQVHRSSQIRYENDPPDLKKQRHPGLSGGSSCGCGRAGVLVTLPDAKTGSEALACIFCDGVHLMPRYAPDPNEVP